MIQKLSTEDFYKTYSDTLEKFRSQTIYTVHEKTQIDYGYENDCNLKWCDDNNIPVFEFKRGGGTIVNSAGNITLIDFRRFDGHTWMVVPIIKSFIEFLQSKGLQSELKRNDIMVDGYKVASGVCRNVAPNYIWQISGIQISINQDLDVIKNACKKKMYKEPKGLSEFGITTADVEEWISSLELPEAFNPIAVAKERIKNIMKK